MTDIYAIIENDLDKNHVWVIGMNPAINPKVAKALQAKQEFEIVNVRIDEAENEEDSQSNGVVTPIPCNREKLQRCQSDTLHFLDTPLDASIMRDRDMIPDIPPLSIED